VALDCEDLDPVTRAHMFAELQDDVSQGRLHLSPWLTEIGRAVLAAALAEAMGSGNDEMLAALIARPGMLVETEIEPSRGVPRRIRYDAPIMLAEFLFNRYYVRAVCRRALHEAKRVQVYRAKGVREPRLESEAIIGVFVDARALLEDLRRHALDLEGEIGVPAGPGSGLSVRLVDR
jgi:hypothetical protein